MRMGERASNGPLKLFLLYFAKCLLCHSIEWVKLPVYREENHSWRMVWWNSFLVLHACLTRLCLQISPTRFKPLLSSWSLGWQSSMRFNRKSHSPNPTTQYSVLLVRELRENVKVVRPRRIPFIPRSGDRAHKMKTLSFATIWGQGECFGGWLVAIVVGYFDTTPNLHVWMFHNIIKWNWPSVQKVGILSFHTQLLAIQPLSYMRAQVLRNCNI